MAGRPTCTCGACRTCTARARNQRMRERKLDGAGSWAAREQARMTAMLQQADDMGMLDWLRLARHEEAAIVAAYLAERTRG